MSIPVLECENVVKCYNNSRPVLNELNLTIQSGKIYGLLGPNGCGKSTLIKLIAGILVPTSGGIKICGEYRSEESNALISYLPERPYFSMKMKIPELFEYFSDFYEDFDVNLAYKMLSDLKIDPNAQLKTLSKGTKEKVQLVLVMARRAKLYLLDEPIGGVDPAAREYILNTIIGNYNPDASVIITTHLITDIEPTLDEFAFMGGGKIIFQGNCDEVREKTGKSINMIFKEVFRC